MNATRLPWQTRCAHISRSWWLAILEWLRTYPDRLSWCKNRLLQIIESPPHLVHYTEDDLLDHFDDFAAQAMVEFWLEDQHSAPIREAITKLALSFRYRTVSHTNRAGCEVARSTWKVMARS